VSSIHVHTILSHLQAAGVTPARLAWDSRRVAAGDVFVAWPGAQADGRHFIGMALERGAGAVLWDDAGGFEVGDLPVPGLAVPGLKALVGHLAHEVHGRPSEALWLAGVTGTNGKTTVSQWIAAALGELGQPCGVIGTLGCGFPGALAEGLNTTPGAVETHRLLADFRDGGAAAAAMEVSSIGIEDGRINGLAFDVALFTNLTRDHLDYHGSMERYAAAKARLFDMPGLGGVVMNADDPFGRQQIERLAGQGDKRIIAYACESWLHALPPAVEPLCAGHLRLSPSGLKFEVDWCGQRGELGVNLVAQFNVSNLLAVLGALLLRGVPFEEALWAVGRLKPPAGRMQVVGGVGEPLIVIDYAHSPDALAKVLEALRPTATARGGRVICVFGCGGDRDPGKRPLMGEIAGALADRVVVTSDNPRSESPEHIAEAILAGVPGAEVQLDRARAIRMAIAESAADDVVVLAGKGHEPYQEIGGQRVPFSDVEQARQALHEWNMKVAGGAR